jgi:hypothetical protein
VAIRPMRASMLVSTPRGGRRRLKGRCHPFLERRRTQRGGDSGGRLPRREIPRLLSRRIPRIHLNNVGLVLQAKVDSGKLVSFDRCLRRPSRVKEGNTILETTFECPLSRTFQFVNRSALRRLQFHRSMRRAATFPFSMFLLSTSPGIRARKISPSNLGRLPKFVRKRAPRWSAMLVLDPSPVVS